MDGSGGNYSGNGPSIGGASTCYSGGARTEEVSVEGRQRDSQALQLVGAGGNRIWSR